MENFTVFNFSSSDLSQNSALLPKLIARAKNGEDGAFTEIYNLYFKKIFRFIFFRVSHKEAAEDLCEDVFLKAFGKISSVANDASFEGWLYQIARNKVIDYYREKQATVALQDVENILEYEENVIDKVNLNQQQDLLLKLLKQLGTEQQLVLKLKFFENLENREIAEILNKTEGAIRVIQHRGIQKLQELTKDHIQNNQLQ